MGMDLFYLGDALRALGLIPTLAAVKNSKDMGNFEVFLECLRLYDNYENGLMRSADLQQILTTKGEQMDPDEVEVIMNECCEPDDEDGCIPYEKFLEKLCDGPHLEFF